MTGGNPMQYIDMIEFPNGSNTWSINDFLSATIDFCVDATAWSSAYATWDLKQTFGETAYSLYLPAGDYSVASNFRVLVNNTDQIGGTYNPTLANTDPFVKQTANLSAYAGEFFTFTMETRNLSKDTLFFTMDNAYIDNVRFSEAPQIGVEELASTVMAIYPNPCDGRFNFTFTTEESGMIDILMMDQLGRTVYSSVAHVYPGMNQIRVDAAGLATGVYTVRAGAGEQWVTGKLIKK
jgi:hypothetical protein